MRRDFGFHIEGLPNEPQKYHGPRARMRELFGRVDRRAPPFAPEDVVDYLVVTYPELSRAIRKLKFYQVPEPSVTLRFFILWCDFVAAARETFFELGEVIIRETGWYPLVTGNRVVHHTRPLVDYLDAGLRKAMNKSDIESLPGLGTFDSITRLANGEGTSILVRSSAYDLVLDTGMEVGDVPFQTLDPRRRKWLFLSHSHRDHTGGMDPFVADKKFVISATPMTLNLWLRAISGRVNVPRYIPKEFFYRFAPMWYRSKYTFMDGSSIEVFPTYHFPGSAGYRFTFADQKTMFYSGDMNVAATYVTRPITDNQLVLGLGLGIPATDYAILDGAFVGRKIGSAPGGGNEILNAVQQSLRTGRNHVLLTPPDDYGLFLFLHLYDALIASSRTINTRVFIDPAILSQLQIIEWRLKRKRKGELDDALIKFLTQRSTLAESVPCLRCDRQHRPQPSGISATQYTYRGNS